ncbi:protein DENND6A [Fopius arisanus]|uniref:Protein DENND6A n=1 Tax=Fopius arisanus TaxID=64838 RepID=A0A9R1TBM4_9HYME|nr:PREDICTED: protein DENND6A [Fopius arisanus]XP_011307174.1 PREDICTED: protein DENND6A [Fopius arisanus]XP_011307175.1 PREDICTED: protein DENND6A [Fopius arisanus]
MSEPSCSSSKKESSNGASEENPGVKRKWENFQNWLHCICVVTFDLELGQAVEAIYPTHVKLSESERSNVCYLAFPDSNSGCMGDTQYHVRIRQNSNFPTREPPALKEYNRKSPSFLQFDKDFYWGYVYFRQVKDKTLPRGYFQKSVVLISKLPFVNLFTELCALLAPEFFDAGNTIMDVAIREIDNWPQPLPGQLIHLPLLGVLFQTYIPNTNYKAVVPSVSAMEAVKTSKCINSLRRLIVASAYESDMFQSLSNVVTHVHLLWELVLLGEPIVVMAGSPTTCAEMVQALVATIAPLKYCADYRPYFTIHDSEFKEYTMDAPTPPAVILGVTNPFFAKTLQRWPHIIRISDVSNSDNQKYRIKKSESLKILDSKPGVYTQYKTFLQKDKVILKKLLRGTQTKRPREVQTALLKRHLMDLTESFMIPLERYIASLMPLQKNISPFKATPIPHMFNPEDFLATLPSAGPQLTIGIKGDWVGLYKRFFRTPNFSGWFLSRYTELTLKLQALQLEALSQADLKNWVQDKEEVEVVDMILRIRQKLERSYHEDVPITQSVREKLCERIDDITLTLPEDLKIILSRES